MVCSLEECQCKAEAGGFSLLVIFHLLFLHPWFIQCNKEPLKKEEWLFLPMLGDIWYAPLN